MSIYPIFGLSFVKSLLTFFLLLIIKIGTEGITISIIILIVMIVCIVTMIHFSGWKMTKSLGMGMFFLYFTYLAQAIIRQLPLIACNS
jgi:hypothetical protein